MKPRILSTARLRSFLSIAGSSLLAIYYSHAADGTWTRTTAGPFDWDNIANWSSGAGPITTTSSGGTPGIGTYTLLTAPGSNPDDDTDGDGVSNAVEYVLGGTSLTMDLEKLPAPDASGSNLTFIFERAQSSIDPGTAVFIETSTDLATWNTLPSPYTMPDGVTAGPPVTVVNGIPTNFDTVTPTVPQAPDAKKFARLKVVITP